MMRYIIFSLLFAFSFLNANEKANNTKSDILIISTEMGKNRQERKAKLLDEQLSRYNLTSEIVFNLKKENAAEAFKDKKLVILDALDGKGGVIKLLREFEDVLEESKTPYIALKLNYKKYSNIEDDFAKLIFDYFSEGGKYNFAQGAALLAKKYFNADVEVKPVHVMSDTGIYHPAKGKTTFETLQEYLSALSDEEKNRPMIGIVLHKENITSDDTVIVDTAIQKLEEIGITPIAFYTKVGEDDFAGKRFFQIDGKNIIDLIISFQVMIMDQDNLQKDYENIGLKVMHGMIYRQGTQEDWENDKQGVPMNWIPMSYTIPEHIGYTDQIIIGALDNESKKTTPIKYQLDMFMNLAINYSKLKHKQNIDKNVAIFYYNYPPGVNNFGSSYMRFPESVSNILKQMQSAGYNTFSQEADYYVKTLPKSMSYYYGDEPYNEEYADLLPYNEYMEWFLTLPKPTQEQINKKWETADKNRLVIERNGKKYFMIPRLNVGNITLIPQPNRGNLSDSRKKDKIFESSLYHDTQTPLPHHYLAVYLYVKKKNDAVVHLGTHGTYEWSYGKEKGLSVHDSPMLSIGDIPNIYPYITNNLAEGIQAKRRGRATLVSHQTPPFGASGTYKELSDIMDLIGQYNQSSDMVQQKTKEQLINLSIKMNLHKDMNYTEEMMTNDTQKFVSDLYDYLNGLSTTLTPLGMHIYGTYPKPDHMIQTLMSMLGDAYIKAVEGEDGLKGVNYQDLNKTKSYTLLKEYIIDKKETDTLDGTLKPFIEVAKEYQNNFINNKEIENLLKGLDSGYIETGVGGDPVRNPASVPTGKNMHGFDPQRIPTEAAYETGKKLMQDYLDNYYIKHGRYPQKITFNLWSLETMRHFGVLESQILYAMGIKPIWSQGGISDSMVQGMAKGILAGFLSEDFAGWLASFVTVERIKMVDFLMPEKMKKMFYTGIKMGRGKIDGVEVIDYSELKRPRIDVVVQATGLYRDTFPNVMKVINDGVEKIAALKEEHNYLRDHSLSFKKQLLEKGRSEEEAQYLSTVRMFSAAQGKYGNGVSSTVDISETWDDEADIAKNFIKVSGHIYGSDLSKWGSREDDIDIFEQNLKGTDAVMFSRTSNLYGMLTSDDPYGYFGSLAMAIRHVDGKSPDMLIANLRDPNSAKMQDVSEFLANELRTRYYNPKWIQEMQDSGYSGATRVLDVINNLWGWQVVYPDGVRSDQWQEFVDIYFDDKYEMKMDEWFKNTNPTVIAQMAEVMLEAVRKGYFQTDSKTIEKLIKKLEEITTATGHKTPNKTLLEFVEKQKAAGYGISIPVANPVAQAEAQAAKPVAKTEPKVKGQKLEEVKEEKKEKTDYTTMLMWIFVSLLIFIGIYLEMRKNKKFIK